MEPIYDLNRSEIETAINHAAKGVRLAQDLGTLPVVQDTQTGRWYCPGYPLWMVAYEMPDGQHYIGYRLPNEVPEHIRDAVRAAMNQMFTPNTTFQD